LNFSKHIIRQIHQPDNRRSSFDADTYLR